MSTRSAGEPNTPTAWHLWRRNGVIWAALLALLLISFGTAYVPLGAINTVMGLAIAAAKAGLVAGLFMELIGAKPLVRLAFVAGLIFVFVFFGLTLADVLTRVLMGWRS